MANRLKKTAFSDGLFRLRISKDTLSKVDIEFMAGRTDPFGDGRYHFAKIAGQMIVLGLIQKLQQFWQ